MQKLTLFSFLLLTLWGHIESSEDEAVKQRTNSYVSAYNKKDAKEMVQYWAQNATYKNPLTGTSVEGRSEIEKQFNELLPDLGDFNLKIDITSVEFPESTKAIERGKATLTKPGEDPKESLFQLTLVNENGQWNISKIDEINWINPPTHYNELKDLEWLIGDWIDKSDTFDVDSSYAWDKYKNFITHHFTVKALGKTDIEGKQIIGWDAANNEVRSWMFDSDGGFAQGKWKKEGKGWVIDSASTLPNGEIGSQVTILTPIDKNSYTLEITGREIDGDILPDIEPVKIVRKGGL